MLEPKKIVAEMAGMWIEKNPVKIPFNIRAPPDFYIGGAGLPLPPPPPPPPPPQFLLLCTIIFVVFVKSGWSEYRSRALNLIFF